MRRSVIALLTSGLVVALFDGCVPMETANAPSSKTVAADSLETLVDAGLVSARWTDSTTYFDGTPTDFLTDEQQVRAHPVLAQSRLPGKWLFPANSTYGGYLSFEASGDGSLAGELYEQGPAGPSSPGQLYKAGDLTSVTFKGGKISITVTPTQGFPSSGSIDAWIGFRDDSASPSLIGTYTLQDGKAPVLCTLAD